MHVFVELSWAENSCLYTWLRFSRWSWRSTAARRGGTLWHGQFPADREWCAQFSGGLQQGNKQPIQSLLRSPSVTNDVTAGDIVLLTISSLHWKLDLLCCFVAEDSLVFRRPSYLVVSTRFGLIWRTLIMCLSWCRSSLTAPLTVRLLSVTLHLSIFTFVLSWYYIFVILHMPVFSIMMPTYW